MSDIAAIIREAGVDAVFLVAPEGTERPSTTGVGVYFRALSQSLMDKAFVHANIYVRIVGRDSESIVDRDAGSKSSTTVRVSELGLTYDLSTVSAESAPDATSSALRRQLTRSVDAAMINLGY